MKFSVHTALKSNENPRISLTRRLNQKQPFRIVVRQPSTVYAYGGFYAVDLDLPGTPGKWNGDWKSGGGRVPRIRAGPKAAALRSMFSRVRANPSTRRSVWLVLGGGMLSRSRLANALARDVPEPHVLQLVHLLLSVYAACQSIGVDFRIFCAD